MSLRTVFVICLILSGLCLAAGYGIAGHWVGVMLSILIVPAWLLGGFLAACGLSIAVSPHRWQERISRRMRDVADGNWSGKR